MRIFLMGTESLAVGTVFKEASGRIYRVVGPGGECVDVTLEPPAPQYHGVSALRGNPNNNPVWLPNPKRR